MKNVRSAAVAASVLIVSACADGTSTAPPEISPEQNAVSESREPQVIPDEYIVVFRSDVPDAPGLAKKLSAQEGIAVRHAFGKALKGFSGRMSPAAVARLRGNPAVDFIEQDQLVSAVATQASAPWGLDRIDQRDGLSSSYNYQSTGAGVTVYIIDTGIEITNVEFGSRATALGDFVGDGRNGIDCNGHGTHVAGTVGGNTYGVAKGVTLKAVRVLNCAGSGTNSGVIAGIDAVTTHHAAGTPAVANMSLGGGYSAALNNAVNNAINDGVTFAVAAGNGNQAGVPQDACNSSPASTPNAITVGATTSADREASFSNYGTCVDILAPGVGIKSAWIGGTTATATISGTSMATPHVAGAAARFLQGNPGALPAQVASAIKSQGSVGEILLNNKKKNTPNLLLYMGPTQ